MRDLRWLLPLALLDCTGENVDEAFVAEHGALLARVDCIGLMVPNNDYRVHYSALMFLDGSVLASVTNRIGSAIESGTTFYERSDAERFHAKVVTWPADPGEGCGNGAAVYFELNNGELQRCRCTDQGGTNHVDCDDDEINVDGCAGFNKNLFD